MPFSWRIRLHTAASAGSFEHGQEIHTIPRSDQSICLSPGPQRPQPENIVSPPPGSRARLEEPRSPDAHPCIIDDIIEAALAAGGNRIWHKSPCQADNEIEIQNLKIRTVLLLIKSSGKGFFSITKPLTEEEESTPLCSGDAGNGEDGRKWLFVRFLCVLGTCW